jgi:hypothetical protein
MGTITRSFANNLTTNGILKANAFNNASLNNVTAINAEAATGNMVLISSQTASASASISFTTGINSTYKEYQFYFINIHPATDGTEFTFNLSTDSGANYNVTKTSTYFQAFHDEADTNTSLAYDATRDLAQSTAFQPISENVGNGNDEQVSGSMTIFNPSSTTYVKHFIANIANYQSSNFILNEYTAGYGNTTSAVNAIQFKFATGNIDDGTILMYGIV